MDDQNIHPIIRYGGPVLGALIIFWVISTMVSAFQTDLEEARTEAALELEQEAAVVEEAEENTEEPALVEAEAGETEDAQAEITEPEAPVVAEAGAEAVVEEETVAEETVAEEVAEEEPAGETVAEAEGNALVGLPDEIAAFFPDEVDPEQGAELAVTTGCIACHSLEEGVRLVGPSWYGLADVADERVEGQSAAEYIYTSIVMPNAYVNEGYPANVMPQTYEDVLSDEQLAHMVAYLLTLEGNE